MSDSLKFSESRYFFIKFKKSYLILRLVRLSEENSDRKLTKPSPDSFDRFIKRSRLFSEISIGKFVKL